ncbi:MAG: bifunctional diaminohydroxyphosphoribosylaminopyrimidine deaminase/5-amino-6-(5-phosphoribosylamino)uracil reductase RibD [Glaciecola sp.]|jgi:diaminohydroxyphosphoribosylaminopyrimidine deaminase/5-amino-6-(5-phosphoribosylamino)uracil reductase
MSFSVFDQEMMARAITLARKGRFTARPNPMVGCVLVKDGNIIGEGWHHQAGLAHAEVNALAGLTTAETAGSTVYVTLEPCSHTGRTGPCAQALIEAKPARVVIAMQDPFPAVAGNGIAMLKAAGINVEVGCLNEAAEALNPHFLYRARHNMPWVTVKLGMSLDGKIALANGQSKWITSVQARRDVQAYRAQYDAILTGAGTVLADDPSMNVRLSECPAQITQTLAEQSASVALRQPRCFVLDSQQRLHAGLYLLQQSTTTVFSASATKPGQYGDVAHYQCMATSDTEQCDLQAVLAYIAQTPANAVWVEAGPALVGALLDAGLVNELVLYQAPVLLGASAKSAFAISPLDDLTQAQDVEVLSQTRVGPDLKTVLRVTK